MGNERSNNIEQILNSLEGNQRAAAPEFFYTRLKARMERKQENYTKPWIFRPAYAVATLITVLVVNIGVILKGEQKTDNSSNADTETAQSIASEYSLNDNNIMYDLTME